MKLEKRSDGGPTEPMEDTASKEKKPVVVYIMILFIAAFLLMAWSFASHQRSNTEALGKLQSSVTAMQEVQGLQDQVISLQKELAEAQRAIEALEDSAAESQVHTDMLELQIEGMSKLYVLQQKYSAQDIEACRQVIEQFEGVGYADRLPNLSAQGVTSPADRYQQLKDAVEAWEAQSQGN